MKIILQQIKKDKSPKEYEYRVVSTINFLKYNIGDVLTREDVEFLMSHYVSVEIE